MNPTHLFSVVTSIQPPTPAVRGLVRALRRVSGHLLVAGDRKGPHQYPLPGAELLSLERQLNLPLRLPALLPLNHYTRKNLGYLVAFSRGADCIYETDDDNCPSPNWKPRTRTVRARKLGRPHWCNVYRFFSKRLLWPRGLPLDQINHPLPKQAASLRSVDSPIQQGLADGSPDVDAIWRLVLDAPVRFTKGPSIALNDRVFCPFNSQSTWWWPEAYPLMYLPSFATFRMTDIWRSFIAQRCLWALGGSLTFHAAEVVQERNPHNLMRDFADEVPGYLNNDRICQRLAALSLRRGPSAVGDNLLACYEALVADNIFPKKELTLVRAWLSDSKKVARGPAL